MTKTLVIIGRCPATEKRLRVVAYCRASTWQEEQNSSSNTTRNISPGMDTGDFSKRVSGLNMKDRAEFQTLMKLCCHRKVDLILVKSFSRLGRNMLDILRALRELRDLSVDVYIREETCGSTMREWRC